MLRQIIRIQIENSIYDRLMEKISQLCFDQSTLYNQSNETTGYPIADHKHRQGENFRKTFYSFL